MRIEDQETSLGTALALIHLALPKLDDPARSGEVQALLGRAGGLIETVRLALANSGAPPPPEPEIAAIIAAAVSVMFDQPHRVLSVQKIQIPVPQSSAWAYEGRAEIFHSHKVR